MKKIWHAGPGVGIMGDSERKRLVLFAGSNAIELSGEHNKIAMSGALSLMHGNSLVEDGFLKSNSGLTGLIPSSIVTPNPKYTINIPIGQLQGMLADIATMVSFT